MVPSVPSQIEEPPMSRTHQYRKVMKPLLERKRRARINKCLDDIKDLLIDSLQTESGESITKLEKADVLELTLKHLQELRRQKNSANLNKNGPNAPESLKQHFNTGYKACAAEVSRYLESMPFPANQGVNSAFGANLMSHLGKQLQGIEMGHAFVPYNHHTSTSTQPLSVMTYTNDISKTCPQLSSTSSSYRLPTTYYSSSSAQSSHFAGNQPTRTLSSSSDCGYSSGRDSVSPHSLASTALSPSISSPMSPKINVEDIDEEEAAVDMTGALNLSQPQSNRVDTSSEGVWRPF